MPSLAELCSEHQLTYVSKADAAELPLRCMTISVLVLSQGISCADVADVCVKALHDPLARNKSFDVSPRWSLLSSGAVLRGDASFFGRFYCSALLRKSLPLYCTVVDSH